MTPAGTVLLLAPSQGLGGGIERYLASVESALVAGQVPYRRCDLRSPGGGSGLWGRIGFVRRVRQEVQASARPVRLVLGHRNLLPVLTAVAGLPRFAGATVILHGIEAWSGRRGRAGRGLRRPGLRVVAASSFTAGAVAHLCPAGVLPPGVPAGWYQTLVTAGDRATAGQLAAPRDLLMTALSDRPAAVPDGPPDRDRLQLVTAFRLASWRDKGLDILLDALAGLGDNRVRLTVCGSGPVPVDLSAALAAYPWCQLAADLPDSDLARHLAGADLFVLCTRTRGGRLASGEGFGLVLLEAQLAGTPVVAPAHGGSADAFLPGITGVAPADETPAALRAVLAPLLNDPARRAALGRAAASWSRTRFAPDSFGRRVRTALLGAEAGHGGGRQPVSGRPGGGASAAEPITGTRRCAVPVE